MTLRRLLSIVLLLAFSATLAMAQTSSKAAKKNVKKQLSTARTNIKNGTSLEETEQSMRTLLEDSANIDNEKIWLTLFDAIKKQYEQLNENLYLKQESDTAKFFTHTLHLFDVLESIDSVDARLKENGASIPRHRHKHASYLSPFRKNLYSGGMYYLNKKDYQEAYKYFDSYISCAQQPLFQNYAFNEKDLDKAAFWATYCGYKLAQPDIVEKYAPRALGDKDNEKNTLQYMAEAYSMKGDTALYHQTLLTGLEKYPDNPYFFKNLAIYYSKNDRQDDVMAIAEKVLAADSTNVAALIAISSALLHKEQYPECIKVSEEIIALDPAQPMPYANAGLSYYNQAVILSEKKRKTKAESRQLQELYIHALPNLERYRLLAEDKKDVWGLPLYNIYFNLNMGDEFEEMEKILKENKQ